MELKKNFPNLLSTLRVIIIPFLVWTIQEEAYSVTIVLILTAMASDLLDGYLARKWKVASQRGIFVDAVADFLFLFSGFVALYWQQSLPWWFLVLLLLSFAHFIEGVWRKQPYDPIGKYLGSYLYVFLLLTFFIADEVLDQCLLIIGTVYILVVLAFRLMRGFKKKENKGCAKLH